MSTIDPFADVTDKIRDPEWVACVEKLAADLGMEMTNEKAGNFALFVQIRNQADLIEALLDRIDELEAVAS